MQTIQFDQRTLSQSAILGEDRTLQFKHARFVAYYVCDVLKILGPLHGYCIAPLFWGKEGAKSMGYWPKTTRGALIMWLVIWPLFSLLLIVVPLAEAALVLAGVRARESTFHPFAQGIFPLLFCLWPPLFSACKYSLMNTERFNNTVLKLRPQISSQSHAATTHGRESESAPQRKYSMADRLDMTEDGINTWTRKIEDHVIARQLKLALWRTGGLDDGETTVMTLADGSTDNLGALLQRTVARHRVAPEFRAIKKRQVAAVALLLPLACIPNIYRSQTGGPFFGSDARDTFVNVCAIVSALNFAAYVFFWGMNKTVGHLRRAREIENEWSKVLLQSFERGTGVRGSDDDSTPVANLAPSAENVRLWARARDALLNFGHGYWLRLSLITAVIAMCVAILVAVLLVELFVRILERDSTSRISFKISPFHLVTAAFCVIFMYFMAKLVLMAMSITSARANLRTSLLRLAAWRSQAAEIRGALRDASDVILSEETFSGQLDLLGVPLDVSVLHTMFSSLVFIVIGFYQEMVRVKRTT